MKRVAVIAHNGKSLGGGLPELRKVLAERGVTDVFWREVPKSRYAPKQVKCALAADVELIFVWGGDGMVQQCIDVAAGKDVHLAIIPAGTANLLATNLGVSKDIEASPRVSHRRLVSDGRLGSRRTY